MSTRRVPLEFEALANEIIRQNPGLEPGLTLDHEEDSPPPWCHDWDQGDELAQAILFAGLPGARRPS